MIRNGHMPRWRCSTNRASGEPGRFTTPTHCIMRTRWIVLLIVALVAAAMFLASWLNRPTDYDAMPLRELMLHIAQKQERKNEQLRAAADAFARRDEQTRWREIDAMLSATNPTLLHGAVSALWLMEFTRSAVDDPGSPAARIIPRLLRHVEHDPLGPDVLELLVHVNHVAHWDELPAEVLSALRRRLSARPTDPFLLLTVHQFGRIARPLQAELLAIDPEALDDTGALVLAMALDAIAWENPAIVDRLTELLADRPDRSPAVRSTAADGLGECGREAAAAVPRLLTMIDAPTDADVRASALAALGRITRDQSIAERALRVLVQDRAALDEEGRDWHATAGRFAARLPASPLTTSVLTAMEADVARESVGPRASAARDAAIALVASSQGDGSRCRDALARLARRLEQPEESIRGPLARGSDSWNEFSGAIELLLDLHRDFPDVELDLDPVRALLEELERAEPTWIRDWAHHQRSRLPR